MNDAKIPRMEPIKKAAAESGLSYDAIRILCLQKKITFIRSGTKFLINMDKFAEYLNRGDGSECENDETV